MKYIFLIMGLFTSSSFLFSSPAIAQTKTNHSYQNNVIQPPSIANLEATSNNLFKTKTVDPNKGFASNHVLHSQLYPIGFSKDGKHFAYYYEPADEACGCYFGELIIQNLVTDKKVFHYKYSGDGDNSSKAPKNATQLWRQQTSRFNKALAQYGIVRTNLSAQLIKGNQLKTKTTPITLSTAKPQSCTLGEEFGFKYNGLIATQNKRSTRIQTPAFDQCYLNQGVVGYITAPTRDRVAIIVASLRRGWEGPPHVVHYDIVGFKLSQ